MLSDLIPPPSDLPPPSRPPPITPHPPQYSSSSPTPTNAELTDEARSSDWADFQPCHLCFPPQLTPLEVFLGIAGAAASSASFSLNTKTINTVLHDRVIGLTNVSGAVLMSTLSRHIFGVTRCIPLFSGKPSISAVRPKYPAKIPLSFIRKGNVTWVASTELVATA